MHMYTHLSCTRSDGGRSMYVVSQQKYGWVGVCVRVCIEMRMWLMSFFLLAIVLVLLLYELPIMLFLDLNPLPLIDLILLSRLFGR